MEIPFDIVEMIGKFYCRLKNIPIPDENEKGYKYLSFIELMPNKKTKVFEVQNKTSDRILGFVRWYAPWRKYCFFTTAESIIFDVSCLADIQDFINSLMTERKNKNGQCKEQL